MTKTILLLLAFMPLLLLPGMQSARAATSYVADSIEVTLRTGPSTGHKVMRMLQSDEPLDVLEEQENWLLVRTRKGDQGWVLKRFISQELPKSTQIQKLTKRNEQLEELSGGASGKIDALEKENATLKEALDTTQKEYQQLREQHAVLENDAANVLALKQQHTETAERLKNSEAELERLSLENRDLRSASQLRWFLSGAGVVMLTWLIGYLMGRSKSRQQSSRLY